MKYINPLGVSRSDDAVLNWLAADIPSSETSFIAIRKEASRQVSRTEIVANALSHGWDAKSSKLAKCRLKRLRITMLAASSGNITWDELCGGWGSACDQHEFGGRTGYLIRLKRYYQ